MSAEILSVISRRVPAGANSPTQEMESKPGMAPSAKYLGTLWTEAAQPQGTVELPVFTAPLLEQELPAR